VQLPSLTIVMPVLNEEQALPRALGSISSQDYPRKLIEVLVVDGGSEDRSRDVVASFKTALDIRLIDNAHREAEWGKALALRQARGELFQCMDADMWLTSRDMLRALAVPLAEDDGLSGTIARYAFVRETSMWNRLLSCDEFQRDPLLEALTPSLRSYCATSEPWYTVCEFRDGRVPPIGGTTMFRREELDLKRWGGVFRDVDHAAYLIGKGANRFAFVESPAWGHEHCRGLFDLVRKRLRNVRRLDASFLAQGHRDYVWCDVSQLTELLRLARWILGSHLVIPRLLEGIALCIRLRRWEPILRPIPAIVVTDALIIDLLASAVGRRFIQMALLGRLVRPRARPPAR
jgi:glycosyltransferase involved in cell wall biosynthesis